METPAEIPSANLGFLDKARVLLACVIAILLMRTVGWHVAGPNDADLAVTLTESGRSILAIWPPLLALTVVSAVIATAIVGRCLPEAGVFAAGIGLAALALRSNSMQMILGYRAPADEAGRKTLMMSMALDALLWAAIMTVTWVVVALVRHWLWPASQQTSDADRPKAATMLDTLLWAEIMAVARVVVAPVRHWLWPASKQTGQADCPKPGTRKGTGKPSESDQPKPGWYALAVTGVMGAVIIWLTIGRTPVAAIARGQVIASVTAGLFLGAMAARYFTGVEDARWYALAALGVALTGYLLGYLNAGMGWAQGTGDQPYADLAITPPHSLVRPLPLEYIAVGVSAALAGFWSGRRIEHAAGEEST